MSYRWLIDWIININDGLPVGTGFWAILLQIFLIAIGFAVLFVICGLLFTTLGGIITAPFNENISQIIEEKITNERVITGIGFWKDAYLSIRSEMQKLLFYFSILFAIFLLNFIPLIGNVVSLILGTIFSFYFYALDFLDYPMQRKLMPFRQKLNVTRQGGMLTYGFGAIAFLLMYLPIINVFLKPILVVAGTRLYWEKDYTKFLLT